ncbi:MAG: ATP phosphoribosyltransferase [Micromonosporaceae bacterium]|nr:ATP phosphoribosyltransferase [Micromonosporaceae bacterium]
MLRIAVPNKGSLSGSAVQMLREAGYAQRTNDRELACQDTGASVEFLYLRPRDIATYVGSGDLDIGITGRDLLIDSGAAAEEMLTLGFAGSTFRFAARPGTISTLSDLEGRRIATSYAGLVHRHLAERDVSAHVIRLDGAVENAVRLGLADVIADVVETGATLRQAGLEVVGDPIMRSEAVLIRRLGAPSNGAVAQLAHRIEGVLVARQYVMVAYDVPEDKFEQAAALTPGMESPTVSPLARTGWLAVQAMILRTELHRVMDELYQVGARAILATDIHACRL